MWPFVDPIATMPGPQFLAFYLFVVLATYVVCRLGLRFQDDSLGSPLPRVPTQPDPFELAYLRGGINELTRLTIFHLVELRYLKVGGGRIEQDPKHPAPNELKGVERQVFDAFSRGRAASDVFRGEVQLTVREVAGQYEARLRQQRLLHDEERRAFATRLYWSAFAVLIGLGLYKLLAAVLSGRSNTVFLIGLMIVAPLVLIAVCRPGRVTRLGGRYLDQLRTAFQRSRLEHAVPGMDSIHALLLLTGIFGLTVLSGTAYADYEQMFHKSSSSGGSCGGGCGSCGNGGDGGGGGCGGCGGGD